jgi:hypothetical protein
MAPSTTCAANPAARGVTSSPRRSVTTPGGSLRHPATGEKVQTTGAGLRKGLQRGVFRSIGVVAQLFEGAAHDAQMYSADHLRLLVGCLEQRAAMQLDDAGAGVRTWGEPELIQQVDHLAASGHAIGPPTPCGRLCPSLKRSRCPQSRSTGPWSSGTAAPARDPTRGQPR